MAREQPVKAQDRALAARRADRHEPRIVHAWEPPKYELADVTAMQALERGAATGEQQKRALNWILRSACALGDMPFRPGGVEGERETNLALGRLFAGQQIAKLTRLDISKLRKNESRADAHEDQ